MSFLNDKKRLMNIINAYNLLPQFITWKNTELRYILGNDNAARIVGLNNGYDFLERQLRGEDLPAPIAILHEEHANEDRLVLENQRVIKKITFLQTAEGDWKLFMGNKSPIFDEHSKLVAVANSLNDITDSNLTILNYNALLEHQKSYLVPKQQFSCIIDSHYNDNQLSKRQGECLFFLLRGKTCKEIAKILSLSYRTVETHIDNIKHRFNCHSKAELIEKCIDNGLIKYIPERVCLGG